MLSIQPNIAAFHFCSTLLYIVSRYY